jgi:hypothetical protein
MRAVFHQNTLRLPSGAHPQGQDRAIVVTADSAFPVRVTMMMNVPLDRSVEAQRTEVRAHAAHRMRVCPILYVWVPVARWRAAPPAQRRILAVTQAAHRLPVPLPLPQAAPQQRLRLPLRARSHPLLVRLPPRLFRLLVRLPLPVFVLPPLPRLVHPILLMTSTHLILRTLTPLRHSIQSMSHFLE